MKDNSSAPSELSLHLSDIILFFKRNLFLLGISAGVVAFAALLYSYSVTNIFTAKTILLPEYSNARSSFWSMAVGNGNSEGLGNLTPEVYPRVLESTEFGTYLLNQKITSQQGGAMTLTDYLSQKKDPGLLTRIFSFFKPKKEPGEVMGKDIKFGNDVKFYESDELGLIRAATSMVSASIEQKNNLIVIESSLPDPLLAASLVEYGKEYLVQYIEDFRTAKVEQQYIFLEERAKEAKKKLTESEYALQSYRDRNRDNYLNVGRIQEQRLQADFLLNQSVYNDLVGRLEQARIRVKEERPVFKVLEPTIVPTEKSKPDRKLYLLGGGVFGFLIALIYAIFYKEKLQRHIGL